MIALYNMDIYLRQLKTVNSKTLFATFSIAIICIQIFILTIVMDKDSSSSEEGVMERRREREIIDIVPVEREFRVTDPPLQHVNLKKIKRIIYNRVPKCGSRTVHFVLKEMGKKNSFNYHPFSTAAEEFSVHRAIDYVTNVSRLAVPYVYARHYHFVNFSSFRVPQPTYINVIREPVDRLISHYNYKIYGSSNKPANVSNKVMTLDQCVAKKLEDCFGRYMRILPYFCGLHRSCRKRASDVAMLAQAKRTVARHYLAVGMMEDLKGFVTLMERLIPHFFKGAQQVYKKTEKKSRTQTKTVKKEEIKPSTREALEVFLAADIDFYRFVKRRFYDALRNTASTIKT